MSPEQKHGVKETKEALVGMFELSIIMAKHLKDGAQLSDIAGLWASLQGDDLVKDKLAAAWEGVKLVDDELKDLNLDESVELLLSIVPYVPKLIEAMKK